MAYPVWLVDIGSGGVAPSEVHGDDTFADGRVLEAPRPSLEVLRLAPSLAKLGADRAEAEVRVIELVVEDEHELLQFRAGVTAQRTGHV